MSPKLKVIIMCMYFLLNHYWPNFSQMAPSTCKAWKCSPFWQIPQHNSVSWERLYPFTNSIHPGVSQDKKELLRHKHQVLYCVPNIQVFQDLRAVYLPSIQQAINSFRLVSDTFWNIDGCTDQARVLKWDQSTLT